MSGKISGIEWVPRPEGFRGLCFGCGGFLVPFKTVCPSCGQDHILNKRGEPIEVWEGK